MTSSIKTETETVIKRVLPYLRRRGYSPEADIDFETAVATTTRYAKGYVDLLVTCGKKNPQFVIEAKRSGKKLTTIDRDQAIAYGKSLKAKFVVVTNGEDIHVFNTKNSKPISWDGRLQNKIPTKTQLDTVIKALANDPDATNIPLSKDSTLPFRPALALKQLNALFSRCHNAIRRIEKNEDHAFADFSKFLFLKLLEEKSDIDRIALPYSYRFHELAEKPTSDSDQVKDAVEKMIAKIKSKTAFGDVLDDPIHLKQAKSFATIVGELAAVSLTDSGLDAKGAAFEYFVRATLKGKKLGQYFTPRPLVEVMLRMVGREKIVNALSAATPIKVLDPACGTGGFLVFAMKESLRILEQRRLENKVSATTAEAIKRKLFAETFYGSDANPGVAAAAKMNMIVAGDGHTNIQCEDSLWKSADNWSVATPDCDLVLTNPPFGTSESESLEPGDADQFPVGGARGQFLFLQKMVLAAKPGADICTVIDEGVLNTYSAAHLRKWILQNCRVVAVVRLPDETFKPNKINVKSSVLYLVRRAEEDTDLLTKELITFVDLDSLGYNGSGDTLRGFDYPLLFNEFESKALNTKSGSPRSGYRWTAFDVSTEEIAADTAYRLDLKYWQPEVRNRIAKLLATGAKTVKELNTIVTERGRSPSAESYVDEPDGFALVVKAGSNISKFGELIQAGDFIEKNLFDETPAKRHLQRGDVLVSSTGEGTLGKCTVYDSDRPAVADGHVAVIRVDPTQVDPFYLCDFLRVGFGSAQIDRLFTGSTGLIELTPEDLNRVLVEIPATPFKQRERSDVLRAKERQVRYDIDQANEELEKTYREYLGHAS
jgi:type I restriction enzyme M protein